MYTLFMLQSMFPLSLYTYIQKVLRYLEMGWVLSSSTNLLPQFLGWLPSKKIKKSEEMVFLVPFLLINVRYFSSVSALSPMPVMSIT